MSQPTILLNTPSGAIVELRAYSVGNRNYGATVSINNTTIAHAYGYKHNLLDQNLLILEHAHIPLMDESVKRASAFLKETASYINGDKS